MKQTTHQISVETRGKGLYEITGTVRDWVEGLGPEEGLVTLFIRHSSASLVIQENADPDVLADLTDFFARLVPEGADRYRHSAEGPDDMPAHIRAALTQTHLAVPVIAGQLGLGTWQGIFVFEHRARGHNRQVILHYSGR